MLTRLYTHGTPPRALRGASAAALLLLAIAISKPSHALQPKKIPVTTPIVTSLKSDLAGRSGTVFDHLLVRWERLYGVKAVEPLLAIAGDPGNPDADRYVAMMGAAKLGGYQSAPLFVPFLKDTTWMLRSAALRILTALENPQTSQAVLPLLKDPALVVRLEAVQAVQKLRPIGMISNLVDSATDEKNYHGGKALWVPQKALEALVSLHASEAMPKLRPLLDRATDPDFLAKTVDALDALAGQPAEAELETADRVNRWKVALGNVPETKPADADPAAPPASTPAEPTSLAEAEEIDSIASHQGAARRSMAVGVPKAQRKKTTK